ncbi:MAG: TIGR00269 family protein [Haloferacaceae archaeon]
MECDKCDRAAVLHVAYSGAHLCGRHLRRSVEKRVRRRIRRDGLLPDDAAPDDPVTWVIGLSGGKDSVVLTRVLADTFGRDPRVDLVALSIHEGIEGYRDESLAAARELLDGLDAPIEHVEAAYADALGVEMDDVVDADPMGMAPCAYCGVFRRDLLARHAADLGADLLLTGHNLDDEAETALMNVLEGDLERMAEHFDASLGALADRGDPGPFVPRAKPLRDVPEREVALYAHTADLPVHAAECPHASESFRAEVQDLLLDLEERHPGTRHSIMAGYEDLAALAAREYRDDGGPDLGECERCGSPTGADVCRKCRLVEAVEAAD